MPRPKAKITKVRSAYHEYALEFAFDWDLVNLMKGFKERFGWEKIGYDPGLKAWVFTSPEVMAALEEAFDVEMAASDSFEAQVAEAAGKEKAARQVRALELKDAMETGFSPNGLTMPLYPYQNVAVEFVIAAKGRAYLAMSPGTGKTAVALAYLAHEKVEKTLVVCPATAKGVWVAEARKWTRLRPMRIDAATKVTLADWNSHDLFITNYDSLYKHVEALKAFRIDAVVCDETHKIKEPRTRRTKAVLEVARRSPRFIALSGTPILSRVGEIFTSLHLIDATAFPNYFKFLNRFVHMQKTPWGLKQGKPRDMDRLLELMAPIFFRRTKEQVLPQLPERVVQDIETGMSAESVREYRLALDGFKRDAETGDLNQMAALARLTALRQVCANGKIDEAIDFVEGLAEDEKVIVFCGFNEPLRQMREFFGDRCVYLTGETPQDERDAAVRAFQEDESVRVFLGGTMAASEAITLTAAKYTVFLDLPFTYAAFEQAASRNHRPGSVHDSLTVYRLLAPKTIDEDMAELLGAKKQLFDDMFGESDSKSEMVRALLDRLKNAA